MNFKACLAALVCIGAAELCAEPFLGYLYPASGRRGTTVRLLMGGQRLWNAKSLFVAGKGIEVVSFESARPFPYPQNDQRKYLKECCQYAAKLRKEPPKLPETREGWREHPWWNKISELDELRFSLAANNLWVRKNQLQATPSIAQFAVAELKIAPDAALGPCEIRIIARDGASEPKLFYVDDAPHYQDALYRMPGLKKAETPVVAKLPATLDGRIEPGETDRFIIPLEKDAEYTFSLLGRKFLPLIGDAVPGWFQPVMRVLDARGVEVAFNDDDGARIDPVIRFKARTSGPHTLEIRDNLYRGREDFVYRVTLRRGVESYRFENCPGDAKAPDVHTGALAKGKTVSFFHDGKAGEPLVIDVTARAFASPLDAVVRLYGPGEKFLGEFDDRETPFHVGEFVQKADPCALVKLPVTGRYRIELADRARQGGAQYRYRIRIGKPQPDFAVYAAMSQIHNRRIGEVQSMTFYVERRDGFNGAVKILSQDFDIVGKAVIPPGANEAKIQFRRPAYLELPAGPVNVGFFAEAVIDGRAAGHEIVPCERAMQAFATTHLLPVKSLIFTCANYRKTR